MSDTANRFNDPALQWLETQIREQATASSLWCLDESGSGALRAGGLPRDPKHMPELLTNRWDLAQEAHALSLSCSFNDFDLSAYPKQSLSQVFYRVSKEKPVTHHIINQACRVLETQGQLFLCGQKNEGIKTYIEKAAQRLGTKAKAIKEGKAYTALLTKSNQPGPELDTNDYRQPRLIAETEGLQFYSKPGLFGWQKLDRGSEFLWAQVSTALKNRTPTRMLDLGCGYGYLGLITRSLPLERRVLTDNNAAAIALAKYNLEVNQLEAEVVATDCAQGINERFDLILCNPPFHQGFNVSSDLTEKFLEQAAKHLAPNGIALFVVNAFIPLTKVASPYFNQADTLADNGRFKVIALCAPKV